ncbi:MAG: cyclic pyranopterin monophosphate synthase MoaC [Opitutaceae bacterium]
MKRATARPLSHVGPDNQPAMVDVGAKRVTRRTARARAEVVLTPEAAALFDGRELQSKKGPVFQTAILAGVMAAKRTHELIPLCHPLPLDDCKVAIRLEGGGLAIVETLASAEARTGVEMEALTAASVAALTLYDMVKALGFGTEIRSIRLLEKTGGKSDFGTA